MRALVWSTIVANLVAHGATVWVLLDSSVLDGVAFFAESDLRIVLWLNAIAAVATLALAVRVFLQPT